MNNLKTILEEALKTLPYNNKYASVRFHLNKAIWETERLEVKEKRRLKNEQVLRENLEKQQALFNPLPAPNAKILQTQLEAIDQMIAAEKQKLAEIQQRKQMGKQKPTQSQDYDDGDDGLLNG
jgi:hypothetical protein